MSRLRDRYRQEIAPKLADEFGISNIHQIPKLQKVVVNIGLGGASGDSKITETAHNSLRKITGQQPVPTIAKKSIASFKLRKGQKIGLKVTLRQERMYEFLDRLISVALPRQRDFHGLARSGFDKLGNYNLGLSDQSVFPELTYKDTTVTHGLEITIVTTGQNREQSARLLELMGLPLERSTVNG